MDVDRSAELPTDKSRSSQEQIHHFLHEHPLSLCMIKDGDDVYCYACEKRCTNSTYACFHPSCKKVYICETCLELPQEICHPFHLEHPLTLRQLNHPGLQHEWPSSWPCNACRKVANYVVSYICESDNCSFRLHVGCSGTWVAIQYEGHNHLWQFKDIIDQFKDIRDQYKCFTCLSTDDSFAFSCLYCNWNLHLTCGPLPYAIKHKCHVHPLILTHSLATYEDYLRDDEFYCDACEEKRDPLLPTYQCMECQFTAEIKCVSIEVISLLRGEHGDVELRNPLGQLGRVITKEAAKEIMMVKKKEEQRKPALTTLGDIFKSLSDDEKNELISVVKAFGREEATAKQRLSQDDDEVLLFSDKAYTKFIKYLDDHSIDIIPIEHRGVSEQDFEDSKFLGLDSDEPEVVNVGDYAAVQRFAPILKHLLSKHGDISAESMFSPRVKVFLFDMLCVCMYTMSQFKVVNINHEMLIGWSTMLKTLERAGFRIQFAVDHLKRLSRAHFGLYVTEQVDNALEKINKDLKALQLKRERMTSAESTKSTFMEECLREASLLKKWKGGTIGLP